MRVLRFMVTMAAIALIAPGMVMGNDDQIAQQIVTRLQEEKQAGGLKGFNIELEVEEGTVWLSGRVASKDQQTKALEVARRVPGVKQVVNDLAIGAAPAAAKPTPAADGQSVLTGIGGAMKNALFNGGTDANAVRPTQAELPVTAPSNSPAFGTGVDQPAPLTRVPHIARTSAAAGPTNYGPIGTSTHSFQPQPVAMSPAVTVGGPGCYVGGYGNGGYANQPVPLSGGVSGPAVRYDHPYMPNYSWPSYAAYPNYAAVTYPKQYSPTAWPYIGPFYPYPQVPLGWRKVCLEWDDGWWMLDFKDHRHR